MKKIFLLLTLFVFTQSFAQNRSYEVPKEDAFQPMFSVGSGYYNSLGDIRGPDGNYLLGNMGINTGIRVNLYKDVDLSLLFSSNAKLHETSGDESFETDLNSIGFNIDYTFNNILRNTKISPFTTIGAQWMYFRTNNSPQESGLNFPIGLGIALDVSERIRFDVGMNYHLSFADIDHATTLAANNDNFTVVNFTLHYNLFTPKSDEYNDYDESNYTNINFKDIDVEDNDGDGIADIVDECPSTPSGVKIDEFGCPFDGDNDGVPDYLDKELDTKAGAVVNERGIQLTDKEYHNMYSEYDAASRKYAKFYNDSEINRDDYKTINEKLIAKANFFNQEYNKSNMEEILEGKRYMIEIGRFTDDIPSYLINTFLSYEDLESIPQKDGSFIYEVGSYKKLSAAIQAKRRIAQKHGELEVKIFIMKNGTMSCYIKKCLKWETWDEEKCKCIENPKGCTDKKAYNYNPNSTTDCKGVPKGNDKSCCIPVVYGCMDPTALNYDSLANTNSNKSSVVCVYDTINTEKVFYRVQLIAMENDFPQQEQDIIFKTIEPKPIIRLKEGGMAKYYTGPISDHQAALIKRDEMRYLRWFDDAFITEWNENGKINLSEALKIEKRNKVRKKKEKKEEEEIVEKTPTFNIKFVVQIGVWKVDINEKTQKKIASIGGADKVHDKGILYKYIAGRYNSLFEAEFRKSEVEQNGFTDAFIYAEKDGKRITVKEALRLLNK